MAPSSVSVPGEMFLTSLGDALMLVDVSPLHVAYALFNWCFCAGFELSESACKPFKRVDFSAPYSFIVYMDIIPIDFQSPVFWGLVFPMEDLRVGVPNVTLESLALQGTVPYP